MKKVYLAGGMQSPLGKQLRALIGDGVEWLDPADWQAEHPLPEQYTARDLAAIQEADVVLGFMSPDNPSGYGLSLEIGYAHALGKRVVFCDCMGADWRGRYFGMIRSVANVVCHSPVEAVDAVLG